MIQKLFVVLLILILSECQKDMSRKKMSIARQKLFEKGGYFEGDMRFDGTRNSVTSKRSRWFYGYVPYEFHPDFTPHERAVIVHAMQEIYYYTGVQFLDRTTAAYIPDPNSWVLITGNDSGCWSQVGRQPSGGQRLNLERRSSRGTSCVHKGTIQHELLHTLGFQHQHSVPERRDFVDIRWENILPNKDHNFWTVNDTWHGCLPYDYLSIMHYDDYAFSANRQPTIVPKNHNIRGRLGQTVLSASDILKIKRMYGSDIARRRAGRSIGTKEKQNLVFVLISILTLYFLRSLM